MTALAKLSKSAREAVPGEKVDGAPLGEMASLVDSLHSNDFLQVLNPAFLAILSDWLSSSSRREFDPSFILRICRELHPYGRHLSMTLRSDLSLEESEPGSPKFRNRKERMVEIDLETSGPELKEFLDGVEKDGEEVGTSSNMGLAPCLIHSHRWNPETTVDSKKRYKGSWTVRGLPFAHKSPREIN